MIELDDLFDAYVECRKNKRKTINAIDFEVDYERELILLWNKINDKAYEPKKSIAFIINNPVKREIFAADFRDRIIHHLIIKKLNPLFEKEFIFDSYSCRVGKGTLFGVKRADKFIRRCSENYTKDCFVLKQDISGFFMHINKKILFKKLIKFVNDKYFGDDKDDIIWLIEKVVFNDPTKNCIIKGKKREWNGLPKNKSLFYSPPNCGLPIGNLTSQIFANFYMNEFDHYMKSTLKLKNYGRYVDDFIVVHNDKEFLLELKNITKDFLREKLDLTIHPNKTTIQNYSKGVGFLGAFIKPNRIYVGRRTKGNFWQTINKQNELIKTRKPSIDDKKIFQSSMNSYLGYMKHYNSFNLKHKLILNNLNDDWFEFFWVETDLLKFQKRKKRRYSRL